MRARKSNCTPVKVIRFTGRSFAGGSAPDVHTLQFQVKTV